MSEEVTEVFTTADEVTLPLRTPTQKTVILRANVGHFHADILGATAEMFPGNGRSVSSFTISYTSTQDPTNSGHIYLSLDEAEKLRNFLVEALAENKE